MMPGEETRRLYPLEVPRLFEGGNGPVLFFAERRRIPLFLPVRISLVNNGIMNAVAIGRAGRQ